MQPEVPPPEEGSSTILETEGAPKGTKRRRPSPRSKHSDSEQSAESTREHIAPATGTFSTAAGPTIDGSSRQDDTTMRSSTPPEGGSIRYTRTGRVSKATKGQRVHQCEECGKLYTRAEHLRRHKQNHKPGAFVCDIPGCGRSFYREDLLLRHKERHNDPLDPPTRRPSIGSQTSAHGPSGSSAAGASGTAQRPYADADADAVPDDLHHNMPITTNQQSGVSRAPAQRKTYIPLNELAPRISIPSNGAGGIYSEYPYAMREASPPYSPTGYDSPQDEYSYPNGPPYYYGQPPHVGPRMGTNADGFGPPAASRSPISAGSSTMYLPQWGQGAQSPAALGQYTSSVSSEVLVGPGAELGGIVFGDSFIPFKVNGAFVRMMLPQERDAMEMDELIVPSLSPAASTADLAIDTSAFSNEQRYLGSYWMWIHPLFPVVHKPSFSLPAASPLLRSAMLALGAHMLQNPTDMNNARLMHESAQKVLKKRAMNGTDTYRVCDIQAIVLNEVYAIFRSRRPPLQFSKRFENVYQSLARDLDAVNQELAMPLHDSPIQNRTVWDASVVGDLMLPCYEAKCKQRLLLACYVLDQQHAMLFGRHRTSSAVNLSGLHLPFIRSQAYWDSPPERHPELWAQKQAAGATPYEYVHEALAATSALAMPTEWPHDAFRSSLMLTCLTDTDNDLQACGIYVDDSTDPDTILHAIEQSPRMRLQYHTLMLCRHTPVRDLLAVAGESWVLAEKLGSQDEFIGAQLSARDWAMGSTTAATLGLGDDAQEQESPVQRAVYHALKILDIHLKHPKTGLLFQAWALYLAAVVIWARAYVCDPTPKQTAHAQSSWEIEKSVTATIAGGVVGRAAARNVLLWTKGKIEHVDVPHNWGLANSALDVLGKLVGKGEEGGWFA